MGLVKLPHPIVYNIFGQLGGLDLGQTSFNALLINAAGESVATIGRIHLEGETGSKTFSSAGAAIRWRNTGLTFANASTNLRIGLQDVNTSTGIEDGTFDVYADLVGGTDTPTSNGVNDTPMESGTKTLSHGDLVAVAVELTGYGGADAVNMGAYGTNQAVFPYSTWDTGSGPALQSNRIVPFLLTADDGSLAWIEELPWMPSNPSSVTFSTGSANTEEALLWTPDFAGRICGIVEQTTTVLTGRDYELAVFSDPLGTPAEAFAIAVDPDMHGNQQLEAYHRSYSGFYDFAPDETIALAKVAQTATACTVRYLDMLTGNAAHRKTIRGGEACSRGSRASGAFTETDYQVPLMYPIISHLHDGKAGPLVGRSRLVQI